MNRREAISFFGAAPLAWPFATRAQQPSMPVVGFLNAGSAGMASSLVDAFRKGLAETGYIEGKNVTIEYRWANGQYDQMPALVADLVNRQVAVLVVGTLTAGFTAKAATKTIPIVFASGTDPVDAGLVESLNHPGANLTGIASITQQILPKRLQYLRELIPGAAIVAMLVNPDARATAPSSAAALAAAQTLGVQIHFLSTKSDDELQHAFAMLSQLRADALLVTPDPFFEVRRDQLIALAARHAVPAIYFDRPFAVAGGLMSYGPDRPDISRQMGLYTGRILKGEKPANLPVQLPTKFELVINLKTAKALGLTVPTTILTTADEVIE
jgi:putative tryptophan/tyrosine transport system substrate-binding protein